MVVSKRNFCGGVGAKELKREKEIQELGTISTDILSSNSASIGSKVIGQKLEGKWEQSTVFKMDTITRLYWWEWFRSRGRGSSMQVGRELKERCLYSRKKETEATEEPALDKNTSSSSEEGEVNVWGETRDLGRWLRGWRNKWTNGK